MADEDTIISSNPPRSGDVRIPEDALAIVPVRHAVLFPGAVAPITLTRPKSIAAVQQAVRDQRPIGILLQRDPAVDEPGPSDLHRICTLANIVRYITSPDGAHHIICRRSRPVSSIFSANPSKR
jgi:ATP-dependent Lon protease